MFPVSRSGRIWISALLGAILVATGTTIDAVQSFTNYGDVRDVLTALSNDLPADLKSSNASGWRAWLVRHDREIRSRLARGDDDTLVNWLLFGAMFTNQPRALLDVAATSPDLPDVIEARTRDLVLALASRGSDERRAFARDLLHGKGFRFDTAAERTRVEQYLRSEVERVVAEQQEYSRRLEAAVRASDVAEEVAVRSQLYRDRGLSLDTTLLPGFAIEEALRAMQNRKLISAREIRRVAIIGPGLDFADKNFGYDFYPPQTLQPFITIDSLARLGLAAKPSDIEVTTFDISARVQDHILQLRERARAGVGYVLRLPLDPGSPWTPEFTAFWKTAGDQVGRDRGSRQPPEVGKRLNFREIEVRPELAARITPVDLNVVAQRWTGRPFDLVIATNVFVYYDRLDQALAFSNVEAMLRPGGFLLTNNPIVELPQSRLRSAGGLPVQYSLDSTGSNHVFWYRRAS